MIIKKVKTYNISIHIEEFDEEAAIEKLQEIARDIKEGTRCCSGHPCKEEPYLPDTEYSCGECKREIYSEKWFEEYTEEEIKKMKFEEESND